MVVLPLPAWEEGFGGWGVVAVWAGLGLEEGGEGTECEVGVDATGEFVSIVLCLGWERDG